MQSERNDLSVLPEIVGGVLAGDYYLLAVLSEARATAGSGTRHYLDLIGAATCSETSGVEGQFLWAAGTAVLRVIAGAVLRRSAQPDRSLI